MWRLWLLGAALLASPALAISYTVQVAALSDQQAAIELRRRLIAEGYEAYLVSVQTEQGVIFRLRVGAFANRAAAVSFAGRMPPLGGATPVPALAEDIPAGLFPLKPQLIASYPYRELAIIPWAEDRAIRFQAETEVGPTDAEHRVLRADLVGKPFRAWRAQPQADSWLTRVYNFPLWPANHRDLPAEARAAFERDVLTALAGNLGLSMAAIETFVIRQDEVPFVVRAERRHLYSDEAIPYPALGIPPPGIMPHAGPELTWLGQSPPEGFPTGIAAPVFHPYSVLGMRPADTRRAENLPRLEGLQLTGNGWRAQADGGFTRITDFASGKSFRAIAGFPIWVFEEFLLVYLNNQLDLYLLLPPQPDP